MINILLLLPLQGIGLMDYVSLKSELYNSVYTCKQNCLSQTICELQHFHANRK